MTFNVRVAFGARRTTAGRLMVPGCALRGVSTRVVLTDWSAHTVESVAGLVVGTVLVVVTLYGHTRERRVALSTGGTDAGGAVGRSDLAFGATTTRQ